MGSFVGDLWKGAKYHVKDAWSGIKDDPERAFLGALTPAGTELWNNVLGKDWDPKTSVWGGATEDQFQGMEAEGIDTGPKRTVDSIADTIAGFYAGQGLGNAFGNMTGGGTSSSGGGLYENVDTGDFLSQAQTGGVQSSGGFDFMDMLDQMPQGGGGQAQASGQNQDPLALMMAEQRARDAMQLRQMLSSLYS